MPKTDQRREAQTSIRMSALTAEQLATLQEHWGETRTNAIARAIDRAYVATFGEREHSYGKGKK